MIPTTMAGKLFTCVSFIIGLIFIVSGVREWSFDGVVGIGIGLFFLGFPVWILYERATERHDTSRGQRVTSEGEVSDETLDDSELLRLDHESARITASHGIN